MSATRELSRHEAADFLDGLRRDISAARLRVTLDEKLGRSTPPAVKKLASLPEPPVIEGADDEPREDAADSAELLIKALHALTGEVASDHVGLTKREHEIARLLMEGSNTRDIATKLMISPRSVEGHVFKIYTKLGVRRRDDLEAAYRTLELAKSKSRGWFV